MANSTIREDSMMQVEAHRQGHFHTLMVVVLGIAAAYYVAGRLGLL
jgi:hypothetical protein